MVISFKNYSLTVVDIWLFPCELLIYCAILLHVHIYLKLELGSFYAEFRRSYSERGLHHSGRQRSMLHHITSAKRPRLKSLPTRPRPLKSSSSVPNRGLKTISELPEENLHNGNNGWLFRFDACPTFPLRHCLPCFVEMTTLTRRNLEDSHSHEKGKNFPAAVCALIQIITVIQVTRFLPILINHKLCKFHRNKLFQFWGFPQQRGN